MEVMNIIFAIPFSHFLDKKIMLKWRKILGVYVNNRIQTWGSYKIDMVFESDIPIVEKFVFDLKSDYEKRYEKVESYRNDAWSGRSETNFLTQKSEPLFSPQVMVTKPLSVKINATNEEGGDVLPRYYIGIDIGGTSMELVVIDEQGVLQEIAGLSYLKKDSFKVGAEYNSFNLAFLDRLKDMIEEARHEYPEIEGIGFAWFGNRSSVDPLQALLGADSLLRFEKKSKEDLEGRQRIADLQHISYYLSENYHVPVLLMGDSEAEARYIAQSFADQLRGKDVYGIRFGTSAGGMIFRDGAYISGFNTISRMVIDLSEGAPAHTAVNIEGAWQPRAASRGICKIFY